MTILKRALAVFFLSTLLVACGPKTPEPFISRHSNNAIEWSGQVLDGMKTGEWILYDSLGNLDRKHRYEKDTLIYRELYFKNRVLTNEEMRGEDIKNGATVVFYEDGTIKSKTNYVMNYQFGHQIFYFPNGQVELRYFQDSATKRDFEQYYPNGNIFVRSEDANNGIVHFHDSLGNPTADVKYSDMVLEDTIRTHK